MTSRVAGQAREGADGLTLKHSAQRNPLSVATTCAVTDAITGLHPRSVPANAMVRATQVQAFAGQGAPAWQGR